MNQNHSLTPWIFAKEKPGMQQVSVSFLMAKVEFKLKQFQLTKSSTSWVQIFRILYTEASELWLNLSLIQQFSQTSQTKQNIMSMSESVPSNHQKMERPKSSSLSFFRNAFSQKKTAHGSLERILQVIVSHHPHPKRSTHIMLPTVSVTPVASLELSWATISSRRVLFWVSVSFFQIKLVKEMAWDFIEVAFDKERMLTPNRSHRFCWQKWRCSSIMQFFGVFGIFTQWNGSPTWTFSNMKPSKTPFQITSSSQLSKNHTKNLGKFL